MILIQNATLMQFHAPKVEKNMDIVLDGAVIKAIGKDLAKSYPSANILDATDKLVYPGIVCSHHHFYSGLARGIMANIGPTPDFVSILKNLWWRMDRALDEESLYYSAMVCSIDAIKSGTTSVIDHHASPAYIKDSLSLIRKGFEETGLRGMTCYEVTDRHGRQDMLAGVEENIRFAKEIDRDNNPDRLVEAAIGGHAPCTINEEGLEAIKAAVTETKRGFHCHVGEGKYDVSHSHITYGEDLLSRLGRHGLLNDKALIVHGVHLSEEEIQLLNNADAFLLHNARSNMNNAVGYNHRLPDVKNLAIGTDGIGANMFEELKFSFFKHKDESGPLWPDTYIRALWNGNKILKRYFQREFGVLQEGAVADLVIADYLSPTPLVPENIGGHFVFGMNSADVETVIVNGKIVMKEREFPFDVKEIYAKAAEVAKKMWNKMDSIKA